MGTRPWTTVYKSWWDDETNSHGGIYAAFAAPEYREKALTRASWDLTKGQGGPAFYQSYVEGKPVTRYERFSAPDGVEPLILLQEMHSVVPDAILLSEEFRLLMNLWEDRTDGHFYSINDAGIKELAVKVSSDEKIEIRTPLLRRYQAARQLDLLLFIDSVRYFAGVEYEERFSDLREVDHVVDGDTCRIFVISDDREDSIFSRVLATKVLPPPPQEKSGIWPWEVKGSNYPEFIIGEDETGDPVTFSCDPDGTGNYFGANPGAPHYLTPVFFRKEVLQRYYNNPALYTVGSSLLRCAGLWSVQIDNHSPGFVSVFLGDLGRDLPANEREHWRSHNIIPVGPMSETTFRRSFLNQIVQSPNPEHIFKNSYLTLQKVWRESLGWELYRKPHGSDVYLINQVHIPLNETDIEFEGQILNLCKLLVDFLNDKPMLGNLEKIPDEKSIGKLKRRLEAMGYPDTDRDISFLRRLQDLRSKVAAHGKSSSYESYMAKELDGGGKSDLVVELMRQGVQMMEGIVQFVSRGDEGHRS